MAEPVQFRLKPAGGSVDPLRWLIQESAYVRIDEDGEDDESPDDDADGDAESETDDEQRSEPSEPEKKPFDGLELKSVVCFGWSPTGKDGRSHSWIDFVLQAVQQGWNERLEASVDTYLSRNVDQCVTFPCMGEFIDLDTDYRWRAQFVPEHMLWKLELAGSPEAEVLPEDAKAFFASEYFVKFAKRCGDLIDKARNTYVDLLDEKLKNGAFPNVSETKLTKLIRETKIARYMDNLRKCKYELA